MINVNQITSTLAKLPDQALQKYAAMHKEDPYIMSLAVAESNRRKQMRESAQAPQGMGEQPKVVDQDIAAMAAPTPQPTQQLPEDVGIGQLPAGEMNFAGGGIIAFAGGDKVEADAGAKMFAAALDAEGVRDPRERAFLMALHAQESSGKKTAATSNRGASGAMQLLPTTFRSVADTGMRIDSPMDNMRAGIRYGLQGYRAAEGDPVLAGAFYYGGPTGLAKARQGVAVADPKNPKSPTTLTYGQQVAKKMTELLPIAAANAEPAPPRSTIPTISAAAPAAAPAAAGLPALTREQMIAQIPGQSGQPVPAQPAAAERTPTLAERFTAPGAVARTLAQNVLAIPFSPVVAGLSQLRSGPGMSVEDAYRAMLYSPKNPAAQEQLETIGRVMEDLKIPAYIPSLTPVRGAKPPSAQTLAEIDKAKLPRLAPPSPLAGLADAAEVRAAQTAPNLGPQLAGVSPESRGVLNVHPDRIARQLTPRQELDRVAAQRAQLEARQARGAANAETEAQLAAQAADRARAAAATRSVGQDVTNIAGARAINEALPGPAARLGLAGLAGNAAAQAGDVSPAGTAPTGIGPGDPGWGADLGQQVVPTDLSKAEKKDIVDATKDETKLDKKTTKGWTQDDWLTLGLNLMATKSPNFLQAVGTAGIATLKARQERAKEERTALGEDVALDLSKARAAQARAETAELTSGNSKTRQALVAADTMYKQWLAAIKENPIEKLNLTPEMAAQKRQEYLRDAFGAYNMEVPAGLATSGLTQLSPADLALIERYNKTKP